MPSAQLSLISMLMGRSKHALPLVIMHGKSVPWAGASHGLCHVTENEPHEMRDYSCSILPDVRNSAGHPAGG